jgi:formyltetrahydrofolate deformylase
MPTPPTSRVPVDSSVIRLLVDCADRSGIVAAVAGFLRDRGANIVRSDQHSTDPSGGRLFMRMEFTSAIDVAELERDFAPVAEEFEMRWRMWAADRRRRLAILVSKQEHCLLDLLWRWRRGELDAEIVLVASNHPDLAEEVAAFGIPYHHVPVVAGEKGAAEAELLRLLADIDVVVLARYMQILSGDFLGALGAPVINIHHSFLPAFVGARPYAQARRRGVKLIGATAHYVTEELDAGPIIEQDLIRVSHRDDEQALTRYGRDIERLVLSRAVQWHCEDRVLVHEGTTVVF